MGFADQHIFIHEMKNLVVCALVTLLVCTCDNRKELTKHTWIIVAGAYQKKPIQFHSTDLLKLVDRHGKEVLYLHFFKDGSITLPGINSPNIRAKWAIIDNKIHFTIDPRIEWHSREPVDLSFLEVPDSASEIGEMEKEDPASIITSENEGNSKLHSTSEILNIPIPDFTTPESKRAVEIYRGPFSFRISDDSLILESENTNIRAVKDRSIEEMFENLQY